MNNGLILGASSSLVCGLANPAAIRVHNQLWRFNKAVHPESWRVELHVDRGEPAHQRGTEYLDNNADLALPICMNSLVSGKSSEESELHRAPLEFA